MFLDAQDGLGEALRGGGAEQPGQLPVLPLDQGIVEDGLDQVAAGTEVVAPLDVGILVRAGAIPINSTGR